MSVNIQTGNVVKIQSGNRVLISAPGPQGEPGTGGTPGGSNTQVQYNDSGSFGGDAAFTFDQTTETLAVTHIHSSLAGNLYVHVKNTSGGTLAKGTPVYATGSVGVSGQIEVAAADYTNSAKMPAIGIIDTELANNGEGNAVVVGEIEGLATDSYTINKELFVGTAGLTGTLPTTGEAQSIAIVSRVHATTGIIVVNTQARLNAALRALANNNGAALTGITADQVGALAPNGDGSSLTGITAAQVGALANGDTANLMFEPGGLQLQDLAADHLLNVRLQEDLSATRDLFINTGDTDRTVELFGNLTVSGTANLSGTNSGNVSLAGTPNYITISGQTITRALVNLASHVTSTLPVANGGTGAATLSANAVLLGNGTSALQTVAPSTSGNVLTSNGTTWTSAAPATTNPAGSGSELQFRSSGTAFGAVTNSSVSGGTLTLGNAEALGTTPTAYLTLRNTTAATSGNQQVSPSLVLEGQGWKTTATAASQAVRFRQNVLPVQGTTNPSATWRLQSEINNSGTWTDRITIDSSGVLTLGTFPASIVMGNATMFGAANGPRFQVTSADIFGLRGGVGLNISQARTLGWSSNASDSTEVPDLLLARDAANTLAQRNSTNAQTFRLYGTFTDSSNNRRVVLSMTTAGVAELKAEGNGTGASGNVLHISSLPTSNPGPGILWNNAGTPAIGT